MMNSIERMRYEIEDNLDVIMDCILCYSEAEANSHRVFVIFDYDWRLDSVEKVLSSSGYPEEIYIELNCRNIYDYVDNPNDYSDEENFESAKSSFALKKDIMNEVENRLMEWH
jgi:hypothetical protein